MKSANADEYAPRDIFAFGKFDIFAFGNVSKYEILLCRVKCTTSQMLTNCEIYGKLLIFTLHYYRIYPWELALARKEC